MWGEIKFPELSPEKLFNVVKMTGGMTVLVIAAVLVSRLGAVSNSSLVGAAVCSGGSCTDTNGSLTITSSPNSVSTGSASTITWSSSGGVNTPNSVNCFGNNAACGTALTGASSLGYPSTFMVGPDVYMLSTDSWSITGSKLLIRKWMPVGTPASNTTGCFGNGTTCNSNLQSITFSSAHNPQTYVIGGTVYMVAGLFNGFSLYKLMPAGTPASNTLGCFGDGAACGTAIQTISNGMGSAGNFAFYTIGSNTYMTMGGTTWIANTFKWMPAPANSGKGCFGNGTACGVTGTINPYQTFGNKVEYVSYLNFGGQDYLVVSDNNNGAKLLVYKWTTVGSAPCTTGGGWGNGTACGSVIQTVQPAPSYAQITDPFFALAFSDGANAYMLAGLYGGSSQTPEGQFYRFMPPPANSGKGCFGNGTTCGTSAQQMQEFITGAAAITAGSQTFLAINPGGLTGGVLTLYVPMPSSNCLGSGAVCGTPWQTPSGVISYINITSFTANSSLYLLSTDINTGNLGNSGIKIFSAMTAPCFGSGGACGIASQSVSTGDNNKDFESFTLSSQTYVARADSGANTSPIYKWMSAQGCLGDGTSCAGASDTSFQTISTNDIRDWDSTTVSGTQYLIGSNHDSTFATRVYQWMGSCNVGQGGFGNGSSCGSAYQTLATGAVFQSDATTTATAGTLLAVGRDASSNTVTIYKWVAAGGSGCPANGGYGDGITCGTAYQTFSSSPTRSVKFFAVGATPYLAVGKESDPNGMEIYKWTPAGTPGCPAAGGFGNGTACGTIYQTIAKKNIYDSSFVVIGTTQYAILRGVDSGVYIYQWRTSGTGCTGGFFGNSTLCNGTPLQTISLSSAYGIENFSIGTTPYLVIGKKAGAQAMQIFSWISGSSCFGDGTVCGTALQAFPVPSGVNAIKSIPSGSNPYLIAGTNDAVYVFPWSSSASYVPACTISWIDVNGTDEFATGNSGSQGTGPLTTDTTYTLACNGISGSVTVPVTIASAVPTLSIISPNDLGEPSTNGSFKFHLDSPATSNLTINYSVGGSATAGSDYTALSGSATISAGQTDSLAIPVNVMDDLRWEGTETVIVTTASSANYIGTPSVTLNITDDETGSSLPTGTFDACLTAGGSCELGVNPARVRKGANVVVTWNISGLVVGANGNPTGSCSITTNPALSPAFSQQWPKNASAWINTTGVSATIAQQTVFTLSCTSADGSQTKNVSRTVQLIPDVQEI